jgi:hypothetical protein
MDAYGMRAALELARHRQRRKKRLGDQAQELSLAELHKEQGTHTGMSIYTSSNLQTSAIDRVPYHC